MVGRSAPRDGVFQGSLFLNGLLALGMLYMAFRSYSQEPTENLGAVMITNTPSISRDVAAYGRKNQIKSGRRCGLTGKTGQTAHKYCFSHKRSTHRQHPNIQQKYVYWPEGQRMVKIKLSTQALKSIDKKGLETMAKEAGIDLNKLPFRDLRPERQDFIAKHKNEVPISKNWVSGFYQKRHRMKNAEKLAASKKTPIEGRYYHGRILWGRFTEDQLRQINDVPLESAIETAAYEEGLDVEDVSRGADTTGVSTA
eukprot:CAMPEP_0184480202 /NCGR_PEP_ID=MMETSP0113_2-20130426/1696_1 /TAXON_ID=91329 /ORGANISM="Norrisiella sphaerica, Strain BC52" /LENGTH=253 /DNA_ID=CAMNT_0026858521 /DNA_START=35 /DNA_END=796 /DNA_ORIENTATION=-